MNVLCDNHPITRGIDSETLPLLLGFNETRKCNDCDTILEIQFADRWYPLFAARNLGNGRVTAWTTGASPHWGINLIKWPQYKQFWNQVFRAEY